MPPPPAGETAPAQSGAEVAKATEGAAPAVQTAAPAEKPAAAVPQQSVVAGETSPAAAAPETVAPQSAAVAAAERPAQPAPTPHAAAPEATAAPPRPADFPPQPVAVAEKTAVSPPAGKGFHLLGGAYLVRDNLIDAERRLRRLGYEPQRVPIKRQVPMTRLRVGTFPAELGESKVRELSAVAPDAFFIRRGEAAVVYAASYYDLDKARRFADQLYLSGVIVHEERFEAEMTLTQLRFGDFTDLSAAKKAADRVRSAGLEAAVVEGRRR